MVIGGEFKGPDHDIESEFQKFFYFSAQQQQITSLYKLVEYTGDYGKFQTGVYSNYYKREMTEEEEKE